MKFIHSPGHSKGSLNIFFEEDKLLFTADSIPLKNDIPNYDNFAELMKSLDAIRNTKEYKTLLTSWTPPLTQKESIEQVLEEGEEYLKKIDGAVKACYKDLHASNLDPCRCAIEKLNLPLFLINPIVDRAFKSHLS